MTYSANRFSDGLGLEHTAWRYLDPFSRRVLLDEVLASHPTWAPDGTVDYSDPTEPLLREYYSGYVITMLGDRVDGAPLSVEITQGNLVDYPPVPGRKPIIPTGNNTLIVAAIIGLIIIAAATR